MGQSRQSTIIAGETYRYRAEGLLERRWTAEVLRQTVTPEVPDLIMAYD